MRVVFFFFSSRRRHTRFDCDWSSDVCSSDLLTARVVLRAGAGVEEAVVETDVYDLSAGVPVDADVAAAFRALEAGPGGPPGPSAARAAPGPARGPAELVAPLVGPFRGEAAGGVAAPGGRGGAGARA